MSAPRFAKRRDKSESDIVDCLRGYGVTVVLTDQPYDALLGFRGVSYLAEFKTPNTYYGRKLNTNQKKFAEVWHGSPPVLLKTPEEAEKWLKSLPLPVNNARTNSKTGGCVNTVPASNLNAKKERI